MIIYKILFLLLVLVVANIAYKGKTFDNTSWGRVIILSLWFIICSLILLVPNSRNILISINYLTISIFSLVTLCWFFAPKLIRKYGEFPTFYFKNKKNNTRFIAKFELPSMTIKYFEVLFQQSTFLYLLFVLLNNFPKNNLILVFTLIIVLIHLGNLFFMDYKWALFYTLLSIPMAIIFGNLILQGLILLTTSIHLIFYLIFNARYWFVKKYY